MRSVNRPGMTSGGTIKLIHDTTTKSPVKRTKCNRFELIVFEYNKFSDRIANLIYIVLQLYFSVMELFQVHLSLRYGKFCP